MEFEWEVLKSNSYSITKRARVFDGWIVLHESDIAYEDGYNSNTSMVFVPDPEHRWNIK
jgi:hypothetical protein